MATAMPPMSLHVHTWNQLDAYQESLSVATARREGIMLSALQAQAPQMATRRQSKVQRFGAQAIEAPPGPEYRGPRLSFPLTPQQLRALALHYASDPDAHVPLHSHYLCTVLRHATDHFVQCPRVCHVSVRSGQHQRLVVVGDLHGQLQDLLTIFLRWGFPSPSGTQYIFNGDFVDRGQHSIETLTLLLAYRLLYPGSVHLNRGNHETASICMKYGLQDEVLRKYGSRQLFHLFNETFNHLPVCAVVDDAAIVLHGGLFRFDGIEVAHLANLPRTDLDLASSSRDMGLLADALWADPQPEPGRALSHRAAGGGVITFGPDVTRRFLQRNGVALLVRSHQLPQGGRGYEVLHDGALVTVFSASNYEGIAGNMGAVLIFDTPHNRSFKEYMAPPLHSLVGALQQPDHLQSHAVATSRRRSADLHVHAQPDQEAVARRAVVEQLHRVVGQHAPALGQHWERREAEGRISMDQWVAGLKEVTGLAAEWSAYASELRVPVDAGGVDWRRFLRRYTPRVEGRQQQWAEQMRREVYELLTKEDIPVSELFRLCKLHPDGMVSVKDLQGHDRLLTVLPPGDAEGTVNVLQFLQSLTPAYVGENVPPEVAEVVVAIEKVFSAASKNLLDMFRDLDRNGDGVLELRELQEFLQWLSYQCPWYAHFANPALAEQLLRTFDKNGSGTLSFLEVLALFKPLDAGYEDHAETVAQQVLAAVRAHSAELRFLFSQLDVSGDGVVDHAEFCTGLRALALVDRSVTDQQLQLAAGLLDTDGDGGISWEEFLQALGGAAPDVYDPAVVRRGSGSGDAAVVRRGSGSGDAAVVRRGSGSWDAAHPPTPKSAGPVPVAGKRCRRVSPEVGPCSLKALDYSDFCHLHTCPVCGKEKQSRAQGCARHPSGGRASLVPPQDPHAARSPRALASASPQGSPRHCLRVSPNGTCHLRPLDKSKYCHLHTCPVCGNEKVSSSKGCTQHPAGA